MATHAESARKLVQQQQKPRLFQETDGCPVYFYIRPGTDKMELAPLILREGGRLCRVQEPGAIILVRSGEVLPSTHGNYVSTRYITDCLAQKKRLPLEDYRLEPQPSPLGKDALQGRMPFTEAEDRAIVLYVRRKMQAGQAGNIAGTTFWKNMAKAQLTSHPWQAMRDRYLKHLQGWLGLEVLAETPKRKAPEGNPSNSSAASQNKTIADVSQPRDQSCASSGSKIAGIFQMANKEFEDSEGDDEDLNSEEEEIPKHTEPKTAEDSPKNQVAISSDPKNQVVISSDPKNPLGVSPDPKNPVVISPDPKNPVVISPDPETPMFISPDPETPVDVPLDLKNEVVEFMNCEESAASESLLPMEKQMPSPSVEAVARAAWDIMNLMKQFGVDLATVTQAFLKTSGDVTAATCCLKTGQRSDGCPLWTRQDDVDLLKGADDLQSKLVAKYGTGNVEARIAFRKN